MRSSAGRWKWNCCSSKRLPPSSMALPGASVDLHRVAVVDDGEAAGAVVEAHRLQVHRQAALDVDRALALAVGAQRELGLQHAPGLRPGDAFVGPVRRWPRGRLAAARGRRRRGAALRRRRARPPRCASRPAGRRALALGPAWAAPSRSASRWRSRLQRIRRRDRGAHRPGGPARRFAPAPRLAPARAAPAAAAPGPAAPAASGASRANKASESRQRRIEGLLVPYRPPPGPDLTGQSQPGSALQPRLDPDPRQQADAHQRQRSDGQRQGGMHHQRHQHAGHRGVGQAGQAGLHRRRHAAAVGHLVQRQQRDHRHHQRPAEREHGDRQHRPGPVRLEQQVQRHVERATPPA